MGLFSVFAGEAFEGGVSGPKKVLTQDQQLNGFLFYAFQGGVFLRIGVKDMIPLGRLDISRWAMSWSLKD